MSLSIAHINKKKIKDDNDVLVNQLKKQWIENFQKREAIKIQKELQQKLNPQKASR